VLDGRVVLLTGTGTPLGDGLADGLVALGARVVAIDGPADVVAPADALVHAAVVPAALEPRPLVDVDDGRFEEIWEGTMRTSLALLQAVHGVVTRVVFLTPTLSMSGAELLTPYAAAVEGQRLLAKSAARQWGADGITVNCVAPAPELVGAQVGGMALSAPALGGAGDPAADLAPIVAFLCSEASHFVTGTTITADGGVWMAP
jgi:3-oxoacyl-[acyl-carrier protein] reductase